MLSMRQVPGAQGGTFGSCLMCRQVPLQAPRQVPDVWVGVWLMPSMCQVSIPVSRVRSARNLSGVLVTCLSVLSGGQTLAGGHLWRP